MGTPVWREDSAPGEKSTLNHSIFSAFTLFFVIPAPAAAARSRFPAEES
ncbi:hypothetical protein [Luteimonas sp. e5]